MAAAAAAGNDARAVFRALLRVRRSVFFGDQEMLEASAVRIRQAFEENRHETNPASLTEQLAKAREAVEYLSLNVVQAKLNDRGNYEVKLKADHVGESLEEVVSKTPKTVSS